MKIISFRHRGNDLCDIVTEDGKVFSLYEDVIIKYGILTKREVSDRDLVMILEENKNYECYYEAIKRLSRRAETETSLTNFLKKKGFDDIQLEFAMEKLNRRGYLSDKSYASSYVNNKIAFSTWGKDKIRRELRQKGVSEDICDKALESFNSNMEEDKIKKRAEKRILANHSKSNLMLKKIIKTDLVSEGFSSALVDKVLDKISFLNEREIEEKTYNKLLSNYIRKYPKKEVEYRVKRKMRELGFEKYQ